MTTTIALDHMADSVMGGCRLRARIGKGAMGVVYQAEQIELQRQVAIKILDPKFSNDQSYIRRFEMEARAAAKLDHPNIVKVYDFGCEHGLYYIISEYIDGGTVQDLLVKEGTLEPDQAVGYCIQVAKGLGAACRANIVHRDIKPDNLMLTSDGTIKVADFGLAKSMTAEAATSDSGLIMGTPFYMSPEQSKGMPMDSRSDIYSLGISLYCMVIGEVPFDADSVVGVLLKQISADRPDPCAVKPALPSVLGSLIMRMMDRDPDNRPPNPDALLTELESVLHILQPPAPPLSLAEVDIPNSRRHGFAPLPVENIDRIVRIEATAEMLARLLGSIHDDSGISITADDPFPVNTVVEIRFRDRGKLMSGIGLVRWSDSGSMGVTFVRVQPVPTESPSHQHLSGPMAISVLTATPLHQRLLRLVYTRAGQMTTMSNIASWLGVNLKLAEEPVRIFEKASLIRRHDDTGGWEMVWADDESLQREIVMWMEQNGLS